MRWINIRIARFCVDLKTGEFQTGFTGLTGLIFIFNPVYPVILSNKRAEDELAFSQCSYYPVSEKFMRLKSKRP
jgi:hypothetical protein